LEPRIADESVEASELEPEREPLPESLEMHQEMAPHLREHSLKYPDLARN
jgi:hypothetical protein